MTSHRRSKLRNARDHAKLRAAERYGVTLDRDGLTAIVQQIQNGHATFLVRQSTRVTVWTVSLAGLPATAVYDSKRHTVVTFLPIGAAF